MVVDFNGKFIIILLVVNIYLGNVIDNINFEYGEGTTVYSGCGATLNGEFWYFGGYPSANYRQVCTISILYY